MISASTGGAHLFMPQSSRPTPPRRQRDSPQPDRPGRSAIAAVSKGSAEVEVTEVEATTLDVGVFAELTGPSLFASERVLVLRSLENLPSEMAPYLIEYAGRPSDDVLVVLVHSGG